MTNEPRCIHRHTIKTHPSCFRKGMVRQQGKEPWYAGKRIAYLDIETTNLLADFGLILTWCLKFKGNNNIRYSVITKQELFDYNFDKRVVQELIDALQDVDIVVTYFGKPFDMKFLRSRALYWGVKNFPTYGSLFHWDIYYHVKKNFRIRNNKLESITDFLGIKGKTQISWEIWNKARYGDKKSLDVVLEHNKQDVIILEKLHDRIGDFSKWIKTSL